MQIPESSASARIHSEFPEWFQYQVCIVPLIMQQMDFNVSKFYIYLSIFVGRKTINSGVHVKGLTEGGEDDFYGIIHRIYELEYNTSNKPKKVVLFFVNGLIPQGKVQEWILNITLWTFT